MSVEPKLCPSSQPSAQASIPQLQCELQLGEVFFLKKKEDLLKNNCGTRIERNRSREKREEGR